MLRRGRPAIIRPVPPEPASSPRADLLASLLAAPPPRKVPPELLRAAGAQGPSVALALFGLIFGGFGLFFVWQFFPWALFVDWKLADAPVASGHVLSVDRTNWRINRQYVYRYGYEFQPPAGGRMRGECFTTGQRWSRGAIVPVRYRPEDPAVSCLDGARLSQGSAAVAFVILFPLIGIALMTWVAGGRRRVRALLKNGVVAEALVTGLEQTNVRINNQPLYRITLQRTDPGSTAPLLLRKYQPAQVALAQERFASKQPVFVLYDPAHPARALLPEAFL